MIKLVSVENLYKKIGKKQVLKGVSFQLGPGRVVGLLGPNGAGKTTLLKILMNLYHADAGAISICGELAGLAAKQNISYMPDLNPLFEWMLVRDAIRYYGDLFNDFDRDHAGALCVFLGIDEAAKVSALSKGMKERVLIMLTLARRTRLYLLDEPIGGIDPLARDKIIKTIFRGLNDDSTVIIATHLVKDVETLLDEVLFLNDGRVIFAGSAESIRAEHGKSVEEWYVEVYENA
jgi:ABC-2 type transport system ATP-binding protein